MSKLLSLIFVLFGVSSFSQDTFVDSYEQADNTYVQCSLWADGTPMNLHHVDNHIYVVNQGKYYVLKEYLEGKPISAKMFGVKADGVTDDTDALQEALYVGTRVGATILLPAGLIITSSDIVVNTENKLSRKIKIQGSGIGNCIIRNIGKNTKYVLHIIGNYFDMLELRDFRIERPDRGFADGGCALRIERQYLANIENIDIFRFTTGVEFNDVNSTYMKSVNVRWCGTGMKFKLDQGRSNPNLIELNNCVFNSCSKWGIELMHPHNVNFISCQFEGNLSGGINAVYDNSNGSNSINVLGSYFEYNSGIDVYIKSLREGSHNFIGNTFNRVTNKQFTNHHIVLEIPEPSNYVNVLNMIGNGVLNANDYVTSSSRPAVKIISPASLVRVFDTNSYKNQVEKPNYTGKNIQMLTTE